MVRQLEPWNRVCPDCGTTFSSVQEWGVCPNCSLRFSVDREGNIIDAGSRPEDRVEPRELNVPSNIDTLVAALPAPVVNRVTAEFTADDRVDVLRCLACYGVESHEINKERIWNEILDRSKGFTHGVKELIITAKKDWRDVCW